MMELFQRQSFETWSYFFKHKTCHKKSTPFPANMTSQNKMFKLIFVFVPADYQLALDLQWENALDSKFNRNVFLSNCLFGDWNRLLHSWPQISFHLPDHLYLKLNGPHILLHVVLHIEAPGLTWTQCFGLDRESEPFVEKQDLGSSLEESIANISFKPCKLQESLLTRKLCVFEMWNVFYNTNDIQYFTFIFVPYFSLFIFDRNCRRLLRVWKATWRGFLQLPTSLLDDWTPWLMI